MGHELSSDEVTEGKSFVERTTEGSAQGFGALAVSLLDLQIALRRCGLTTEQEAILWDAVEAGSNIYSNVSMDDKPYSAADSTDNAARAVEAWEDRRFDKFGA